MGPISNSGVWLVHPRVNLRMNKSNHLSFEFKKFYNLGHWTWCIGYVLYTDACAQCSYNLNLQTLIDKETFKIYICILHKPPVSWSSTRMSMSSSRHGITGLSSIKVKVTWNSFSTRNLTRPFSEVLLQESSFLKHYQSCYTF